MGVVSAFLWLQKQAHSAEVDKDGKRIESH